MLRRPIRLSQLIPFKKHHASAFCNDVNMSDVRRSKIDNVKMDYPSEQYLSHKLSLFSKIFSVNPFQKARHTGKDVIGEK